MATLEENVAKVVAAHTALKAAVAAKGVTVPDAAKLTDMAGLVAGIGSGDEPPETPTLTVLDNSNDAVRVKVNPVDGADAYYMILQKCVGNSGIMANAADAIDITANVNGGAALSIYYKTGTTLAVFFASRNGAPSRPRAVVNYTACLLEGTPVTLADGTEKPIEAVRHDDELLVWDFDRGTLAAARPAWIKRPQIASYHFLNALSDGRLLRTTGRSRTGWGHRMYDETRNSFVYTTQSVGDTVRTLGGPRVHVSCTRVDGPCRYYNVITERHYNLFANGILTSCSLSNGLGDVVAAKYAPGSVVVRHDESAFAGIPARLVKALRLTEQRGSAEEVAEYVRRLVANEATVVFTPQGAAAQ